MDGQFQQEQGFIQWTEDYPALPDIAGDIAAGKGYLLREGDTVLGYLCLDFDGEPAYTGITEGSWRWEEPYGVVHRLALNRAGRGQASAAGYLPWWKSAAGNRASAVCGRTPIRKTPGCAHSRKGRL